MNESTSLTPSLLCVSCCLDLVLEEDLRAAGVNARLPAESFFALSDSALSLFRLDQGVSDRALVADNRDCNVNDLDQKVDPDSGVNVFDSDGDDFDVGSGDLDLD